MGKFLNIIDNRYNKLLVLSRAENRGRRVWWNCLCDCGNKVQIRGDHLKSGHAKSCGCWKVESYAYRDTYHGLSKTKEYKIYYAMQQRCYSESFPQYYDYGARGIKVCDRWMEDAPQGFLNFLQDMGKKPKGKSLDRIDVNSGYSPENCTWTDYSTQVFNQRRRNRNTSGKTGVCWDKRLNKWQVNIRRNKVKYYLGVYSDFQEAVKVREDAELKYFGFIKE